MFVGRTPWSSSLSLAWHVWGLSPNPCRSRLSSFIWSLAGKMPLERHAHGRKPPPTAYACVEVCRLHIEWRKIKPGTLVSSVIRSPTFGVLYVRIQSCTLMCSKALTALKGKYLPLRDFVKTLPCHMFDKKRVSEDNKDDWGKEVITIKVSKMMSFN